MDKILLEFKDQLKAEIKRADDEMAENLQKDLQSGIFSIPSCSLSTEEYTTWRYNLKKYLQENYRNNDTEEMLKILNKPALKEEERDVLMGLIEAIANSDKSYKPQKISTEGIFISHSSKDSEFILKVSDFFRKLGIDKDSIFCSSLEGQGVKNGERLEEKIRSKIISSRLLFYVISDNFFRSSYCIEELGAGWILRDECVQAKKVFILKLPNCKSEFEGFVNADFKYTVCSFDSLMGLIDDVSEIFGLGNKKATEIGDLCKTLLNNLTPN